ncbi:hypothetical protein [Lactococcus chungangensis]
MSKYLTLVQPTKRYIKGTNGASITICLKGTSKNV